MRRPSLSGMRGVRRAWLAGALACLLAAGCAETRPGLSARYRPGALDPVVVVMPANAPPIAQQFYRTADPRGESHNGLDILGPRGMPVLAAAPGRVVASYYEPAYGNRIRIDHGTDAAGLRIFTKYYHLDRRLRAAGDLVARGEEIGRMGSTGILGTAVHLHFEVEILSPGGDSDQADPHLHWAEGTGRVSCFEPGRVYGPMAGMTYPVPCP